MPLGIDPKVDFAFKLMLGSPEHPAVTIHFLNAILRLPSPVTEVEILNPIQGKDRSEDKLVILDILARDQQGRKFNVEMQTTLPTALPRRLLYYNCLNYLRQIGEGDGYAALRPAVSICVLDRVLFHQEPRYHHSFRLRCDQSELVLTNDFEFHILELPKFAPSSDADRLSSLLSEPPFDEALGVLAMISKNPDDLQFYEARLKFLRDEEAKLEAAMQEGMEKGIEKGIEKGMERGIEKGMEKGLLAGKVQTLQELLGEAEASNQDLLRLSLDELSALVQSLQSRLRGRDV